MATGGFRHGCFLDINKEKRYLSAAAEEQEAERRPQTAIHEQPHRDDFLSTEIPLAD